MKLAAAAIVLWSLLQPSSAAAQQAGWEVRIPDKLDLPAAGGTLPISIAVDRGLSISKDAGLYLDLAPPAGVTIKRRRWQRRDAVDPEADEPRFAVPVKADQVAPDAVISIHVRFWVCGAKVCRPVDVKRTVAVAQVPESAVPAPSIDH